MSAQLMLGQPVVDAMVDYNNRLDIDAGLVTIQVGNDPRSTSYIKQLHKIAPRLPRLRYEHHDYPEDIRLRHLLEVIDQFNRDKTISGMMVQVPLPKEHFTKKDFNIVRNCIAPHKDLDVQGNWQLGEFMKEKQDDADRKTQLLPSTPYAVMKMLQFHGIDVFKKVVSVVGSGTVGKPLSIMMMHDHANVSTYDEHTVHLLANNGKSDIVISAAGAPRLITGDMLKPGGIAMSTGMTQIDGKWVSDIDEESVRDVASYMTPVMGGVGPVTVMSLIQNAFRAALAQQQ